MSNNDVFMTDASKHRRPLVFFAYPSHPYTLSETIRDAAAAINRTMVARARTWEDMSIVGKNIIREICAEVNEAQIFCSEVTGLSHNVMFELGYAIARDKRIWPILDTTLPELRKQFDQLGLLSATGFARYTNSNDILGAFLRDHPYLDLENTIFRQSIQSTLSAGDGQVLLYLKSRHDTNASIRISKCLQGSDIPVIVDDPSESGVQPLTWYGQQAYSSAGVVAHLLGPAREGSQVINAKYALVAGLALGFGKPILMLAEPDYISPLDYRELLFNYKTATEAVRHLQEWLDPIEKDYRERVVQHDQYSGVLRLKVELRDFYLQIGEFLAENEASSLENYYLETTAYREALAGAKRIFVGRKGTGKTANLVALASQLGHDKNALVCALQPVGYEIESLVKLFSLYRGRDVKGYVIESLWKFLLLTEIANATADQIDQRPLWIERDDDEKRLLEFLEHEQGVLKGDFSVRLERSVTALLAAKQTSTIEQQRKGISEALHENAVKSLRAVLDDVLSKKNRVAILIDNLDRAWVREADIAQLSEFLLGLFSASNQLLNDLSREDSRRKAVKCTSAIFLRSDIYNKVVEFAREPDKLSVTKLTWDDPEMLSRVVELRYLAAHPGSDDGSGFWNKYFSGSIKGLPSKEYIMSRILPRPRDLVYLVKNAISVAVNRGHALVEEGDVLAAEYAYSRFAIDAIMVENSITLPQLESVLVEFAGCPQIVSDQQVAQFFSAAGLEKERHPSVVGHLVGLSFLGVEVAQEEFVFSDEPRESKKYQVLADKLAEAQGARRYQIHAAFRAYLEVTES